ncbi:phospholipase [Phototrophicus methaneseepsis]|uniref:phospholipase D n=1 Tax=Phototrophicus methaneseepsis TaxID=2710758 RepID=A0A7S8EAG3_9CHLR|nr:phospholipase D-like domain-containing protein [Phototrophicus methaneseepsis]QPC83254.1 phospholipase [Phototrophicus methaneseepsis]
MTNRRNTPSQKSPNPIQGCLASVAAALVFGVGVLIFALTGVDLFGVIDGDIEVVPTIPTVVVTQPPVVTPGPQTVSMIPVGQGFGYGKGFWQVYFTAPTGERNRALWTDGIDVPVAQAIDSAQATLDIAAFELNNEVITAAILRAHERGVQVRIVTDDENGIEDDDSTLLELEIEDIPIVNDERTALMHNKFIIVDGISVWMGSLNYTMNGVYRNNNNLLQIRSRRLVEAYQQEFNEMFVQHAFGPTSPTGNGGSFTVEGVPMQVYFASEDDVMPFVVNAVNQAQSSIVFMAFSFTRDDLGQAMLARAANGVHVEGVFETTGSGTQYSEMTMLACAGLSVMRDGNNGVMHHKVIILDGTTVITGSFNFSDSAAESNDENLLIIQDKDLATLYTAEYDRVRSLATTPEVTCDA